jgi:hypothetical protein
MWNKIKKCLSTQHPICAYIFYLQGYGQYEMHESIVNVLTNFNLMQNVLLQMSYDDCSIFVFLKRL